MGQAPITANLEMTTDVKKYKVEVEIDVVDIVGLLTRADTSSNSRSRSRGRLRSRRAGPQGPGSSRPSWEGLASGREGGTQVG